MLYIGELVNTWSVTLRKRFTLFRS